jgi:POT family proton-dependent oligopeptide transporter
MTSTQQQQLFGHPAGLFILFFTEMWERFSYYGMRAILVLFLVSAAGLGGWEWTRGQALELYATYTGLVYITPILGGFLADRFLGFKLAVLIGALLMTLGHASMAFETETTFYLGIALLIIGNGFFKPNISSIVGGIYGEEQHKKDGGYTIFYMGINAGAFLGILLCGYIGEKVGWSYGFGLAGIFMFFGMLQFYFAQKIFGNVGDKPKKKAESALEVFQELEEIRKAESELVGFDEENVKQKIDEEVAHASQEARFTLMKELKERFRKKISGDRLLVISILAFFTIFFWMAFEQAGGSMTIFAKDYTNRILSGSAATTFTIVNALMAIVPLGIITWVLLTLFRATFKRYGVSNLFLGASFVIIWGVVLWMVNKEFNTNAYEVQFTYLEEKALEDQIQIIGSNHDQQLADYIAANENLGLAVGISSFDANLNATKDSFNITGTYTVSTDDVASIRHDYPLEVGANIDILDVDKKGSYVYVNPEGAKEIPTTISAKVVEVKDTEIEVAASWFGILNSLFIILFAPVFSKIWESKYNPTAPKKFAMGLTLLGLGFAALAFGSMAIPKGAETAAVSMVWLILAYLLHTLGELAVSPVGLSYVSKLSPPKLVSLMFGVWFTASAIANFLAGMTGSYIDRISESVGLTGFFLIFTILPIGAAVTMLALNKFLVKKMHGIH